MKYNFNWREFKAVLKVALPTVERAVLTATAVNTTLTYKHKDKVTKGLVRASVVTRVLKRVL